MTWRALLSEMNKFPYINIILFFLTLLTTTAAGMIQQGIDPVSQPERFGEGMPFSLTLLTILLCHELAHYLSAKKHNINATLPYFIPAPHLIGTFGAVIKMKSPITTRSALIDIGASGPIAGFVVSVAATIIGLSLSSFVKVEAGQSGIFFGESALFNAINKIVSGPLAEGYDVILHPIGFAGWLGFFFTSLNLIPVGQLDGGHVLYAAIGKKKHTVLSYSIIAIMVGLGIICWEGWLIWALLLTILGAKHPPIYTWEVSLDPLRKILSICCLIIFLLTFIPVPFMFIE